MEINNKIKDFPPFILNAPKIKFKKPTIAPIPFTLSESLYSIEHSDSDTNEDFSDKEKNHQKDSTQDIESNSPFTIINTLIQN